MSGLDPMGWVKLSSAASLDGCPITPEPTVLAYLAGMIDADGYITITRSVRKGRIYHGPQVGIAGTRSEPHELAASIWGGGVYCYTPRNPKHRPQFQWSRTGAAAITVIEAISPYLRVKAEQAYLASRLWEHLECGRDEDPYLWFGPEYDPIAAREEMRVEAILLNQSRNRVRADLAAQLPDNRQYDEFPEISP